MRFHIITLFSEMFAPLMNCGVSGRAFRDGIASAKFWKSARFLRRRPRQHRRPPLRRRQRNGDAPPSPRRRHSGDAKRMRCAADFFFRRRKNFQSRRFPPIRPSGIARAFVRTLSRNDERIIRNSPTRKFRWAILFCPAANLRRWR